MDKILSILNGMNPATEKSIRPSSIYQRHNREWTPLELKQAFECCGFGNIYYSTNINILGNQVKEYLLIQESNGYTKQQENYYGPELFMIGEKLEHLSINMDLDKARRWPEWLYTSYDGYRKRPKQFPVIISDDYA